MADTVRAAAASVKVADTVRVVAASADTAMAVWSDMAWAAELECKVALAVSSVGAAASITAETAYEFNNSNIDNGKQFNWEQK